VLKKNKGGKNKGGYHKGTYSFGITTKKQKEPRNPEGKGTHPQQKGNVGQIEKTGSDRFE